MPRSPLFCHFSYCKRHFLGGRPEVGLGSAWQDILVVRRPSVSHMIKNTLLVTPPVKKYIEIDTIFVFCRALSIPSRQLVIYLQHKYAQGFSQKHNDTSVL